MQSKSVLDQFNNQGRKDQIVPAISNDGHHSNSILSAKRTSLLRIPCGFRASTHRFVEAQRMHDSVWPMAFHALGA